MEAELFWRRGSKFVCHDHEHQRLSALMCRHSTEPSITAGHLLFSTRGATTFHVRASLRGPLTPKGVGAHAELATRLIRIPRRSVHIEGRAPSLNSGFVRRNLRPPSRPH
jgi:hypothetical protein